MTIGYNRLGSNGRFGNQMFQYAGLRGIAANRGFDWVIPNPNNYGDSNYGLFDCFKMSSVKEENFGIINAQSIQSGQFHFSQELFDNCPDNVNLHDYFQTEKYFKNIEILIREDYTFKDEILEPCKQIFSELDSPIFLHVRRGDYVNHQYAHPLCSLEYYQKALEYFDEDSTVLVFSDDVEWCKEQEIFSSDRFMISEYNERYSQTSETKDGRIQSLIPYFDLCMMSLCSGAIIANSSMSWWGAWLMQNRSKPIIAPKLWFAEEYIQSNNLDMNDLLPESWIEV
jgi:hypothetical protein